MKEVAQAIKVFPIEEEQPSPTAAVLVPLDALQAILNEIKSLQQEVKDLKGQVKSLEALEEIYHGPAPLPEEVPLLREMLDESGEKSWMICHLAFGELKRIYRLLRRHFIKTNQKLPAKRLLPESRS